MRRLTFLIALLALGLAVGLSAHTVNVGTVTTMVDCFPINTYFGYNYTQQIYTQPQINYQGEISKIRFYRGSIGDLEYAHDWTIYMGHTSRNSFSSQEDWEPVSNLTQVFSGSVLNNFPAPGNWMEITLELPFNYDNVNNLILAVYENTPYWDNTLPAEWGAFNTGGFTGLFYYDLIDDIDINNPPDALARSNYNNAIQLVFPDTEAPMPPVLVFPEDNASIVNGQDLRWTLAPGSADVSGYDVYIDGSIVSDNQTANRYTVSGLSTGAHTWQVVARNNIGSSAPSETRNFTIAGGVVIGTGTSTLHNMVPIYTSFNYSYTQSVFMQPEININNHRIESIAYYWHRATETNNSGDWVIYMGHTRRTEFAGGEDWVPVSELTQVFSGQVDIPNTSGWVEIELDTPFAYNNSDNLVIAVDENTPGRDINSGYFYNTDSPGQNRSKIMYSNGYNIDPATVAIGNAIPVYPNIMLQFGPLPPNPILSVSPPNIDFGTVLNDQTNTAINVVATNLGGGILNLSQSDVSIIGPNAAEFWFDPLNLPAALGPGESVNIPVNVTGVSVGEISATLRIVYDGENYDVGLSANVLPAGVVVIGDGTLTQRHPFGLYYGHERSATLYTADQIGTEGFIDMISWDCANPSNANIPYRILAKNTTQTSLTAQTWQELTADMTLLKEGRFRANNTGWNNFQLTTPFAYAGESLIIAVESNIGGNGAGGSNSYRYTGIDAERHLFCSEDMVPPTGPGIIDDKMPNVMLHLSPELEDIGALSIAGNPSPAVGEETIYTITLRNNGSSAQNDYLVKLVTDDGTELASLAGPSITPQETLQVSIPWTPAAEGPMNIHGKVVLACDQYGYNDQTSPLLLNITPAELTQITVGNGSQNLYVPLDYSHQCSLYQNLYFADEIGAPGIIYKLVLYNDFSLNLPNMPVKIWMGLTDVPNLVDSWIPASQLTLVYDGNLTFPTGQNQIIIPLQTPFTYSGGNLLVMFKRPPGIAYENCYFKGQSTTFTRARSVAFDGMDIDPNRLSHPGVTFSNQYPQTTFLMAPLAAGNISGTVTDTDNQPLGSVTVSLSDGLHFTTTDIIGQYQILNILPGDYTVSFNKYGYCEYTHDFTLAENDQLTIDATLQLMSQVNVSGTVRDDFTGSGIPDAVIQLSGFASYQATTDAEGEFSIAGVFANQTYAYTITAADYPPLRGQIVVGDTDYNMGDISLSEYTFAPVSILAAEGDDEQMQVSWLAPNPYLTHIYDSFEDETFPPAGWTEVIFNSRLPYPDLLPTWSRAGSITIDDYDFTPASGNFHAGMTNGYYYRDEWLITPLFNCRPNSYLSFYSHVFLGSTYEYHNYVKASADGGATWTVLWDAAEETGGWYDEIWPISINLSAYAGQQLKIAFHAHTDQLEGGYCHPWFIDCVYIGTAGDPRQSDPAELSCRAYSQQQESKNSRVLTGYMVYRLRFNHEQDEADWVCLTSAPTSDLSLIDTDWDSLPNGDYRWAVKAIYSNGTVTMPVFSNVLNKGMPMGTITGTVKNQNGEPIVGATLTNLSNSYSTTTTTDSEGAYSLDTPTGVVSLRVSAEGYHTVIKSNIIVYRNVTHTLDVVLRSETANDDAQPPVLTTALKGNYPNPFNPETTISYSVKEPGKVKLEVYNIKGQLVRTLVDEEHAAGYYKQVFNSRDERGRSISSGVYLIRMTAPGYHKTSKMILMQ